MLQKASKHTFNNKDIAIFNNKVVIITLIPNTDKHVIIV